MTEEDLERIARTTVKKYLEFNIKVEGDINYKRIVFSFVNKIINASKQEITIENKK